jgi:hypothetical protein
VTLSDLSSSLWTWFPLPGFCISLLLCLFFKRKKHEKRGRKENRIALEEEEEEGCDKSNYGTRDILMELTWI